MREVGCCGACWRAGTRMGTRRRTRQPSRRHRRLERPCYTKSEIPDPYRLPDQLHEQRQQGHSDDDIPHMGNGIDWNESHNSTRYPDRTH